MNKPMPMNNTELIKIKRNKFLAKSSKNCWGKDVMSSESSGKIHEPDVKRGLCKLLKRSAKLRDSKNTMASSKSEITPEKSSACGSVCLNLFDLNK